ncbi:magnesium and cobalt transport protein CorA [Acidihalobacter ferrooxydans]|uniref:Magnesium transport protein CorA n=1 Tax=Acidihalobacter ferrooxydans TaxID=1765967 RepID=A0A1P8UL11_9GAMM|nr:magnesium and cobalt transport protein CorA [Acidihalobacter ferrooxydans]
MHSNRTSRAGLPPGTLLDEAPDIPAHTRLIHYGEQGAIQEEADATLERFKNVCAITDSAVSWMHVQGQPDRAFLEELGMRFDVHPLALEDIQSREQRPKLDDYDEHLFVVLNVPRWQDDDVVLEQFSLLLGEGYVISIHDSPNDISQVVRERLARGRSRLREHGADYLMYALMDLVVDQAFPVLESFGENIEQLEANLIVEPRREMLNTIQTGKRTLIRMRRQLWPTREVISRLARDVHDEPLMDDGLRPYLGDLYDHTVQLMELMDTYRDVVSGLMDIYLSSVNNRLSDIMRTLTVISVVFIPLTFITGLYGMNFAAFVTNPWTQPLLRWKYGYPFVWFVMLMIVVGMLGFFKRRGWIMQKQ